MRRALLLGLLAVALLLTGCLRDPVPLELDDDTVTVHSLLVTGSDSALVMVTRARENPTWDEAPFVGVSGGEVRLIAGEDTTWLIETPELACIQEWRAPSGIGCYRATLPAPIADGGTYGLEIRLPDGTRVRGETTAPAPVTISAPAPDIHVTAHCHHAEYCYGAQRETPPYQVPVAVIPLAWVPPASVAGASVALRAVAVYLDGVEYPGEACQVGYYGGGYYSSSLYGADDGEFEVPNIGCNGAPALAPVRFDSIRVQLDVMGWNATYREYLTSGSWQGVRSEAASHGIAGAFGFFGAMSRATRSVVLVRDPPPAPISSPVGTP